MWSALSDISTEIVDEGHGKATVQDLDLMMRLKESDIYNRKKMGEYRNYLAQAYLELLYPKKGKTSGSRPKNGVMKDVVLDQAGEQCCERGVKGAHSCCRITEQRV